MGRAPTRSGVARLEARFRLLRLLPWPLTRVQRIWHLFAFMDVPRRIARERVPTMGVDLIPYVDAHGRPRTEATSLLRLRKTPQSEGPCLAAKKACCQTRKNVRNRIDIGSAAVTVPVGWFTQCQSAVPTQKKRP
jgi:hypothetical protein